MPLARELGEALERIIHIEMEAYPNSWTDAEKREAAERIWNTPDAVEEMRNG